MSKRGALSDISPSSACAGARARSLSDSRLIVRAHFSSSANRARTDAGPAAKRRAAPAPAPVGGVFESAMEEAGVRLTLVPKEDDAVCAVRWQCTSLGDAAAERGSVARLLEAVRGQLRRKFVKSEAAAEGARGVSLDRRRRVSRTRACSLSHRARVPLFSPGASQRL